MMICDFPEENMLMVEVAEDKRKCTLFVKVDNMATRAVIAA